MVRRAIFVTWELAPVRSSPVRSPSSLFVARSGHLVRSANSVTGHFAPCGTRTQLIFGVDAYVWIRVPRPHGRVRLARNTGALSPPEGEVIMHHGRMERWRTDAGLPRRNGEGIPAVCSSCQPPCPLRRSSGSSRVTTGAMPGRPMVTVASRICIQTDWSISLHANSPGGDRRVQCECGRGSDHAQGIQGALR